jgi:hypothetical protein
MRFFVRVARAAAARNPLLLLGQTNLQLEWLLDSISLFEVHLLDDASYRI